MDFTDCMFNYNKQTTTKKTLYSRKSEGKTNIWYQVELTVLLLGHYQFICINKWYTIQLLFSAVKEWQLFPESSVDQFPLNSRFGNLQLECFYFNSKIGSKCTKCISGIMTEPEKSVTDYFVVAAGARKSLQYTYTEAEWGATE